MCSADLLDLQHSVGCTFQATGWAVCSYTATLGAALTQLQAAQSLHCSTHTGTSTDPSHTATGSTEFTLQHSHSYKHRPQSHSYKRRISGYCIHTLIIRLQRTVRNEFPILRPNLSAFVAHSTLLSTMYEICSPAWGRGLLVYSRTSETHLTR